MRDIKGLKIAVEAGHTKTGSDTGACGIGNEYKMNVEVKNLVMQKLKTLGAIVQDCSLETCTSLTQSLAGRATISNKFGAKYHICIHHNAFNGKAYGAEVEHLSQEGANLAKCIQKEFVKLGFKDRSIHYRDNLYILRHTNAICVLAEGCFVDNVTDMKLYDPEKEAQAIVSGLINYLKSK